MNATYIAESLRDPACHKFNSLRFNHNNTDSHILFIAVPQAIVRAPNKVVLSVLIYDGAITPEAFGIQVQVVLDSAAKEADMIDDLSEDKEIAAA